MGYITYEMFYVSLMVTTMQEPRGDSQNIKKGETEHTIMKTPQFTKVGRNREKRNNWNS